MHRDLKPDNVYIHGKRGLCKIGDFGFAKLVVDSSMTQNTVTIKNFSSYQSGENDARERNGPVNISATAAADERIVYKLINMSQVGTPSYIAPELRMLIDSHLNFSSVETINEKIKLCEKYIYKGDVFSFGCILYELTFLRLAFENRFQLPSDVYLKTKIEIDTEESYSDELRAVIKACLEMNPAERPNVRQVMRMHAVESRLGQSFEDSYKRQVTPALTISTKKNVLLYQSATLPAGYKPIAMKSLKFNHNLIVILAVKQGGSSSKTSNFNIISSLAAYPFSADYDSSIDVDEESRIFVYNEFGKLLHDFSSYLMPNDGNSSGVQGGVVRKPFSFAMYDLCVDEEFNHLYVSTRRHGIMRFRIVEHNNSYLDDIVLDGSLDLSEMHMTSNSSHHQNHQQQQINNHRIFPTCLTLVEDESSLFKDTVRTTHRRRIVFYDRTSKQIVSVQVDLASSKQSLLGGVHPSIRCSLCAGLTLEQKFPVRQMVCNARELICLFDDLNLINVYNLKTLLLLRTANTNTSSVPTTTTTTTTTGNHHHQRESLRKNTMCLTLSSDGMLYSTNGKSIFNLDNLDFKQKRRISPFVKKGENLANTFSWITILTNSKLVLLTDALQMEPSTLYILKPVSSRKNL